MGKLKIESSIFHDTNSKSEQAKMYLKRLDSKQNLFNQLQNPKPAQELKMLEYV